MQTIELVNVMFNWVLPEVQDVTFAGPGFCYRPTKLLLAVLNVRFPVKNLDEVEIAVVWLLKKKRN